MTEEQATVITDKLVDCMNSGSISAFMKVLEEDLSKEPALNACICVSQAILKSHTFYKSDMLAVFLEKAIHYNMEWAKFGGGKNPLFRVCFATGSWNLYTCYLEEVEGLDDEFLSDAYVDWLDMNEKILDHAQIFIKGQDYSSGFTSGDRRIIDLDDFEKMNFMAENYNTIIGRHKILKDLENRL